MDWLEKISITCFAASYAVVLAMEVARIFRDITTLPWIRWVRIVFAGAGFFAHTVFLGYHTNLVFDATGIWLGSWFGWCLSAAWILAAFYFWLTWRKPDSPTGIFLLPVVLLLIGLGSALGSETHFTADRAKTIWSMVHGISLLLGTAIVALGFTFGAMYLFQSRRLKQKSITGYKRFRMPSLEWLGSASEWTLGLSAAMLLIGLISGLALNIDRKTATIPWSDPVVWSSAVLFGWLLAASLFSLFYKPARQGRKVAYLVLASFLFLILELGIVWSAGHAVPVKPRGEPTLPPDNPELVEPVDAPSAGGSS